MLILNDRRRASTRDDSSYLKIVHATLEGDYLGVRFSDGSQLRIPFSKISRLAAASPEDRAQLEIFDEGLTLHWPNINVDLSTRQIRGCAEE